MREAHALDVWDELGGQLAPGQRPVGLFGLAPPRPHVNLVDRHGIVEGGAVLASRVHPCGVAPLVTTKVPGDRRGLRRALGEEGERIRLEGRRPLRRMDLELVGDAFRDPRQEQLPEAAGAEVAHRVDAAVPVVEIADDGHAPRVGRPDDEAVAARAVDLGRARPHLLPGAQPVALAEQIGFVVGDDPRGRA